MSQQARIEITATDKTGAALKSARDGLQRLDATANGLVKGFGDIAGSLGRIGAVAGLGAVAAGLGNMVSSAIAARNNIQDLVEITGGTANGLSAIASEAEAAGVGIDTVSSAMVRLTSSLAGQDEESGKVAKALDAIGLSTAELKALAPDQALFEIAKAFNNFEDGAGKSAVATALFGKSGAQLLPLLNDLAEKTELVGTVTGEQAQQAADLGRDWGRLQQTWRESARTIGGELIPVLSEVVGALTDYSKQSGLAEIAGNALRTFFETVVIVGANVAFVFKGIGNEIGGIAAQLAALASGDFQGFGFIGKQMKADAAEARKQLEEFEQRVLGLNKTANAGRSAIDPRSVKSSLAIPDLGGGKSGAADEAAKAAERAQKAYADLIGRIQEKIALSRAEQQAGESLTEAEKDRLRILGDIERGTLKLTPAQREYVQTLLDASVAAESEASYAKSLTEKLDEQDKAVKKLIETNKKKAEEDKAAAAERVRDLVDPNARRSDALRADVDKLREAMERGEITAEQYRKGVANAMRAFDDAGPKQDPTLFAEAISGAFDKSADALANFAATGKLAFADLARSIIADIARLLVKKALMDAAFGDGKTNADGSTNNGLLGLVSTGVSAYLGSSGGRANGGPVSAGGSYKVLEKGMPELLHMNGQSYLMAPRDGYVTAMQPVSAGAAGGVVQNINVTVQRVDGESADETAARIAGALRKEMRSVADEQIARRAASARA